MTDEACPWFRPFALDCPLCGKPPGEPCIVRDGAKGYHPRRAIAMLTLAFRRTDEGIRVYPMWLRGRESPPAPRPA
jgi:hypothetical protein